VAPAATTGRCSSASSSGRAGARPTQPLNAAPFHVIAEDLAGPMQKASGNTIPDAILALRLSHLDQIQASVWV